MKSILKRKRKKKKNKNKTKQNKKKNTSTSSKFDPNKKKNVLEGSKSVRCAPGADLNQSNIYQRKVEKTCITVSTCMINFRIESSYIFDLKT